MRKFFKILLGIIGLLIAAVILLLATLTITDYCPASTESAESSGSGSLSLATGTPIRMLTWNTGYGGLDAGVDFFMDGGTMTFPSSQSVVENNVSAIASWLQQTNSDICLLQEVDRNSSRTKHLDELSLYQQITGMDYSYAPNYRCLFVPFPLPPLGQMESGIVTLSSCLRADISTRISLPSPYTWPVSTANLKRCLLVDRFPLANSEKELVVINLHLDAYESGEGRVAQTKALLALMADEYAAGNYCIAGGDFNQLFPDTKAIYPIKNTELWTPGGLTTDLLPDDWQFAFDTSTPSCRLLNQPYDPEDPTTQYFVIDGFILTPNVTVDDVQTVDLGFANSDHNPVTLAFTLKP